MPTERSERRSGLAADGFTLVEVLVAMVVLAVGLLGVEALGIGAARSINQASRQSELAAVAMDAMERSQQEIRRDPAAVVASSECHDGPASIEICTDVDNHLSAASLPSSSARVTVRVRRSGVSADSFSVSSYVFDPALP